ncbi:MAG: dephospho-CoA kinase [Pseudomonadota bacterium]|nr:dephospho-CoA kinase [Pseudomonadota bacterium]
MSLIVGLTGGIGSGKTAASDHFESLGITVVDADLASRVVVEKGRPALEQIANHFGSDFITDDGELNRARLREEIFASPEAKQWLEALLHPLIREEIQSQLQSAQSDYTILVSPLLIETDQHLLADRVLLIDVPEELQLQRTMDRDSNSAEQVKAIMASQASRELRRSKADDIVLNDGALTELQHKIEVLHQTYLELSK